MNNCVRFLKDRSKLNMSIDILMLIVLMAMAGIGFLIKYVLVSGEKRNAMYGENVNLEFLGLDRHEWGTIHLIVSIFFLVLIILHVVLHWKMILCVLKRMIPRKSARFAFVGFVLALSLLLIIFAFIIQPQQVSLQNIYRNRTSQELNNDVSSDKTPEVNKPDQLPEKSITSQNNEEHLPNESDVQRKQKKNKDDVEKYDVQGTQSLHSVATMYNVPSTHICNELNIPTWLASERLGRLRKRYGFTMSDVSRVISDYKKQN